MRSWYITRSVGGAVTEEDEEEFRLWLGAWETFWGE